jgi:hypothetical protein
VGNSAHNGSAAFGGDVPLVDSRMDGTPLQSVLAGFFLFHDRDRDPRSPRKMRENIWPRVFPERGSECCCGAGTPSSRTDPALAEQSPGWATVSLTGAGRGDGGGP